MNLEQFQTIKRDEFRELRKAGRINVGDRVEGIGFRGPELVCEVKEDSVITYPLLSETERPSEIHMRDYSPNREQGYAEIISDTSEDYQETLDLIQQVIGVKK